MASARFQAYNARTTTGGHFTRGTKLGGRRHLPTREEATVMWSESQSLVTVLNAVLVWYDNSQSLRSRMMRQQPTLRERISLMRQIRLRG